MKGHLRNDKFPHCNYLIDSENYKLFSHDIRDTVGLDNKLTGEFGVKVEGPVFVMTECLLIYLKKEHNVGILNWLGNYCKNTPYLSILNYEMIEPFDSFG